MTDRPMLFSAPMIRALLDGRKTQTRRVIKPQPAANTACVEPHPEYRDEWRAFADGEPLHSFVVRFQSGDRMWVRETWRPPSTYAHLKPRDLPHSNIFYAADKSYAPSKPKWVPSIHMPRWASRLTLIVEAVKVERLTDISEADAQAEGVEPVLGTPGVPIDRHYAAFMQLWDSLHGEGATYANPWVVAVTFRVVRANIDDSSLFAGWVAA